MKGVPSTSVATQALAWRAGAGRRLRARVATADQLMSLVAAVLLPLGLVLVFLGWYGAAHTPYLFEQVPYLLSGGLLGLGLVLTGGFVLFGSWIAQTSRKQRLFDLELLAAVQGIQAELARLTGPTRSQEPAPEPLPSTPARRNRRPVAGSLTRAQATSLGLVATARGSMLHRPDCAVVSDRQDLRDMSGADVQGLPPCRLCDPFGAAERTHA